jgi:hypothetical protein
MDSIQDVFLHQLQSKKIVAIGDGYHGNASYMQLVVQLLNAWVGELEKERVVSAGDHDTRQRTDARPTIPHRLLFFVEHSQRDLDAIRTHFQHNDIQGWLAWLFKLETNGRHESGVPLDDIDYFESIFALEQRVARLNPPNRADAYDLRILGPESDPPYTLERTRDAGLFKIRLQSFDSTRFQFFVHQRDERTFANIRAALDEYKNYKAVVFYGASHLLRGIRDKGSNQENARSGESAYGYYLASYLDRSYTRDSVSIITPIPEPYRAIHELARDSIFPDYHLCWYSKPPFPTPLEVMNCDLTLHALVKAVESYKDTSEADQIAQSDCALRLGYMFKRSTLSTRSDDSALIDSMIQLAHARRGFSQPRRIEIAKQLIDHFDAVENIESLDRWITLPLGDSSYYLPMLRMCVWNLPPSDEGHEITSDLEIGLNDATKAAILAQKETLIEYFLVNLLRIGTPKERSRAIMALERHTGKRFKDIDGWKTWWASKYE